MPWCRASALARHLRCPAASWLPRWDRSSWQPGYLGDELLPAESGFERSREAADYGTEQHALKADGRKYSTKLYPKTGRHEQCYSYNCKTGAVLQGPTNVSTAIADEWKSQQAPECVVGTADFVDGLLSGPWIDDLKTGWLAPPTNGEPMLFYGLCEAKLCGSNLVHLSITHDPRPKKDEEPAPPKRYWYTAGIVELDAFEAELQKAYRLTSRKGLDILRSGPHCEYCPSVTVCSVYNRNLKG